MPPKKEQKPSDGSRELAALRAAARGVFDLIDQPGGVAAEDPRLAEIFTELVVAAISKGALRFAPGEGRAATGRRPRLRAAPDRQVRRAILHRPVTTEPRRGTPTCRLTPRELDILPLLAKGNTNRQIAALLRLSMRTVENHRANLMGKLGLVSRVELVTYAEEHRLI